MELLLGEELKTPNYRLKIRSLQKKKTIRAVNDRTFKVHLNPLFSKLKVFNLDDTFFMHRYFNDNFPASLFLLKYVYISLDEPNRTKSYKLGV